MQRLPESLWIYCGKSRWAESAPATFDHRAVKCAADQMPWLPLTGQATFAHFPSLYFELESLRGRSPAWIRPASSVLRNGQPLFDKVSEYRSFLPPP